MKTFLFVWNPVKWPWPGLEKNIGQVEGAGRANKGWTIASHKAAGIGDRAFMARVGVEPRGIFGSGHIASAPVKCYRENGREYYRVQIEFDVLLDPDNEQILTLDILKTSDLAMQNWTPQASGISVRLELVEELEALWADFLSEREG